MKRKAFTMTEVLLAVAVIGVAAALIIPSLIANVEKKQFETGLKKAVKVVNDAISMNIAKGKKSAYYTNSSNPLYIYMQDNLNAMASSKSLKRATENTGFYTLDMRFEFPKSDTSASSEFNNVVTTDGTSLTPKAYNCGTKGMEIGGSTNAQEAEPCVMLVDVNGDTGPNKLSDEKTLNDMFIFIVTDKAAFPYGTLAQKICYE